MSECCSVAQAPLQTEEKVKGRHFQSLDRGKIEGRGSGGKDLFNEQSFKALFTKVLYRMKASLGDGGTKPECSR